MRNLFLALVLANLAFAAWHAWFAQPPRAQRPADPEMPSLTLLSEVPDDLHTSGQVEDTSQDASSASEPAEEDASTAAVETASAVETAAPSGPAAAEPEGEKVAAAAVRCTSVGPFRELSQAATAAASLRASGYAPQQRVAEGDIWIGYWVYIQAIPTVAEANEILAKVRADGIADSYVIPNSDSGNLVSLGVFSEISGVSRRREQVRALGYEPQVVDRTRRATVYWIDVALEPGRTLDFDALQTPGRIQRLEQRACESAPG
jgi:cell division septation protein DedD